MLADVSRRNKSITKTRGCSGFVLCGLEKRLSVVVLYFILKREGACIGRLKLLTVAFASSEVWFQSENLLSKIYVHADVLFLTQLIMSENCYRPEIQAAPPVSHQGVHGEISRTNTLLSCLIISKLWAGFFFFSCKQPWSAAARLKAEPRTCCIPQCAHEMCAEWEQWRDAAARGLEEQHRMSGFGGEATLYS